MHIVYAGIRKTAWIFLLVPALACILQMSAVMAFASASLETTGGRGWKLLRQEMHLPTEQSFETATVSDAESSQNRGRKHQRNRNGI